MFCSDLHDFVLLITNDVFANQGNSIRDEDMIWGPTDGSTSWVLAEDFGATMNDTAEGENYGVGSRLELDCEAILWDAPHTFFQPLHVPKAHQPVQLSGFDNNCFLNSHTSSQIGTSDNHHGVKAGVDCLTSVFLILNWH